MAEDPIRQAVAEWLGDHSIEGRLRGRALADDLLAAISRVGIVTTERELEVREKRLRAALITQLAEALERVDGWKGGGIVRVMQPFRPESYNVLASRIVGALAAIAEDIRGG